MSIEKARVVNAMLDDLRLRATEHVKAGRLPAHLQTFGYRGPSDELLLLMAALPHMRQAMNQLFAHMPEPTEPLRGGPHRRNSAPEPKAKGAKVKATEPATP